VDIHLMQGEEERKNNPSPCLV